MKYAGMPSGMWMIFSNSFKRRLITDLKYTENDAALIAKQAKPRYREIIERLPEFEKEDRFKTNIVNCALLISFLLCMDRRPTASELTKYYENAMSTTATKIFCRLGGKSKFTDKDVEGMKKTAALNAAD